MIRQYRHTWIWVRVAKALFGVLNFAEAKTNITQFRKEFISALSKLGEEGNTIWKRINEDYEGDVDAFIAAINAGIENCPPQQKSCTPP